MTQPVFRFAPSPNGRLHLGHAYSALLNEWFAARSGGRLLLRIEDIDVARCRPAFESAIFDDLAWLGVAWEQPVRRQSEHLADYRAASDRLRRQGVLYPCFCSRQAIAGEVARREAETHQAWPRDPDGAPRYPGTCRALSAADAVGRARGEGLAWRLAIDCALTTVGPAPLEVGRFDAGGGGPAVEVDAACWGMRSWSARRSRRATISRSWSMMPFKV